MEPFNLFSMGDDKIDKISSSLQRWEEKKIRVPVKNDPKNEKGFIEWELKPTYQGEALRVQDMMDYMQLMNHWIIDPFIFLQQYLKIIVLI